MPNEKVLMNGDYDQITLTTHRIRQENKSWGKIDLVSIMLEEVTSCEYNKKSKPFILIIGLLIIGFSLFIERQNSIYSENMYNALLLIGVACVLFYLLTIKRGLFISSPTAKIKLNTSGMNDDNIKSFIDKLEIAKNNRLLNLKNTVE